MARRPTPPDPRPADIERAKIPSIISKLERRIKDVREEDMSRVQGELSPIIRSLCTKIEATLTEVFGNDTIEYKRAAPSPSNFYVGYMSFGEGHPRHVEIQAFEKGRTSTISKLQAEIDILKERMEDSGDDQASPPVPLAQISHDEIFVVHGQDDAAQAEVAHFLAKAGLKPIILHEQPNGGKTVIEKFENRTSNIGFVVVLLTPDDEGGPRGGTVQARARQNVIAELFYFMGKLGRSRVCALKKGALEIPSDIAGLVYTEMDPAGAWKMALVRELKEAGYGVRLEALV